MACAAYAQYSLTANTTSNAYVLQLVSLAIMGSIGFGGILSTAYRLCKVGQSTHLAERLCQATTLLVPFRTHFRPRIPIPGGWRSLESSACLRDQCSCLSTSSSMPSGGVFAAHQKSGRHAGPRLKTVGQTTFQAYRLKDWPFQGERAVCAAVRVSLSHRRPVWPALNFCVWVTGCPRWQKTV